MKTIVRENKLPTAWGCYGRLCGEICTFDILSNDSGNYFWRLLSASGMLSRNFARLTFNGRLSQGLGVRSNGICDKMALSFSWPVSVVTRKLWLLFNV